MEAERRAAVAQANKLQVRGHSSTLLLSTKYRALLYPSHRKLHGDARWSQEAKGGRGAHGTAVSVPCMGLLCAATASEQEPDVAAAHELHGQAQGQGRVRRGPPRHPPGRAAGPWWSGHTPMGR